MIPYIYSPDTTTFNSNGRGPLTDILSCTVTEELNGMFELEATYPVNGVNFDKIEVNCIIRAIPNINALAPEPFRIYKITKPLNGIVTIYAQHMSYIMNYIPVMPITKATMTASQALTAIKTNAAEPCPLTFTTDINTTTDFGMVEPVSMASMIGGIEGSFLDTYGGEITRNYPYVSINQRRGTSKGFTVAYGKNLTELMQEVSMAGLITGICPFARYNLTTETEIEEEVNGETQTRTETTTEEIIITLTEKVIESQYASVFPFHRTAVVDLTEKFADKQGAEITEAELRTVATQYVNDNAVGVPKVSIQASYVNIRDNAIGAQMNFMNSVDLGDTVTVQYQTLFINVEERVRRVVYDVIKERYESVTIGEQTQDLSSTIFNLQNGVDSYI